MRLQSFENIPSLLAIPWSSAHLSWKKSRARYFYYVASQTIGMDYAILCGKREEKSSWNAWLSYRKTKALFELPLYQDLVILSIVLHVPCLL